MLYYVLYRDLLARCEKLRRKKWEMDRFSRIMIS